MRSTAISLEPRRGVQLVSAGVTIDLKREELSAERIGAKALGLSTIPEAWTLPFFVVDANCCENFASDATTVECIQQCLVSLSASLDSVVIVRSSGSLETMRERGSLSSRITRSSEILDTIRDLHENLPAEHIGAVHWIVQKYIEPRISGQLSNERRVSRESRDWLLAIEHRQGISNTPTLSQIAVRTWREGKSVQFASLACSSEPGIALSLKPVALWATQCSVRMHFEWLWDGQRIYLLQADSAEVLSGVNPADLMPNSLPTIEAQHLSVFRQASQSEFESYTKLRNAAVYQSLGYTMPEFYVLDDAEAIRGILAGDVPAAVARDLAVLTRRALIIRTDGLRISKEKREMLPRSDELSSIEEASAWLIESFRDAVLKDELGDSDLCLVAHHFIPSVASAWAHAEPMRQTVRIESLWGIPEGLYWHSHDTFEVDVKSVSSHSQPDFSRIKYPFRKRRRFKGTFIGPDSSGRWRAHEPAPPNDWGRSIKKNRWLFEIAARTREIAEHEGRPTSVMWFVDNHPQATRHQVLPWYHGASEISDNPKAAPKRKWRSSRDVAITNQDEWLKLKRDLETGQKIERVLVQPKDLALVRNPRFAKELGELAISRGFVIELAGGILSHAYYLLQSAGPCVECVDLFGAQEDIVDFNKVIRDKIAQQIVDGGEKASTRRLAGDALVLALRRKLVEEAFEALDAAGGGELIGELADVLEVVRGLAKAVNISFDDIESERIHKKRKRGGFDNGTMLISTSTPHSALTKTSGEAGPPPGFQGEDKSQMISEPGLLPSTQAYRKLDSRRPLAGEFEKMLTLEADLTQLGEREESIEFEFQGADGSFDEYSLHLEIRRDRGAVRAVVRVRKVAEQLELFKFSS